MKSLKRILTLVLLTLTLTTATAQSWITNGLVAYYPFNGNANDESGNGANATATDVVQTADRFGSSGQAAGLNGSSSILVLPHELLHLAGSSRATVSAWVRLKATTNEHDIFTTAPNRYYTPPPQPIGILWSIVNGTVNVNTASDSDRNVSRTPILPGVWYHLVVVYDGLDSVPSNKVKMFCNGERDTVDQVRPDVIPTAIPLDANYASLGGRTRGDGSNIALLGGDLDDVRIYNRALSDNEVAQLYASEASAPPTITQQPVGRTVNQGDPVTFEVIVTSSTVAPTYQWRKDGLTLPGATGSSLTFTNVQPPRIGDYTVVITNASGSVTSSMASLSISNINSALWKNLVAYYPFNGNANDESGFYKNGTVEGATIAIDRFHEQNRCYNFNGIDNRISTIGTKAPVTNKGRK